MVFLGGNLGKNCLDSWPAGDLQWLGSAVCLQQLPHHQLLRRPHRGQGQHSHPDGGGRVAHQRSLSVAPGRYVVGQRPGRRVAGNRGDGYTQRSKIADLEGLFG